MNPFKILVIPSLKGGIVLGCPLLFFTVFSVFMLGCSRQVSPARLEEETDPVAVRQQWVAWATKLAEPIFDALDKRELKLRMPVESAGIAKSDRGPLPNHHSSHLEAVARLLAGIAPWLELGGDDTPEGQLRERLAEAARRAIDAATDPDSHDKMNFESGNWGDQRLVEAAFLAQATFRAPRELWEKLEPRVKANLVARLKETRGFALPRENNHQLFAAFVELALARGGELRDDSRLFPVLENFQKWYLGDGTYGDGPEFRWDYYNSYVIQPMLLDILDAVAQESESLRQFQREALAAARRYAAVQERFIAPDGSYPVIGRSITYRAAALQTLADVALRHELPETEVRRAGDGEVVAVVRNAVSPAVARTALTRAIRRTMDAPGTFDEEGWLRIGLAGHQPLLGELYITTGSLYLCSVALLPLGLPPDDPFWSDPHEPTTWERVWGGASDVWADRALYHLPAPEIVKN